MDYYIPNEKVVLRKLMTLKAYICIAMSLYCRAARYIIAKAFHPCYFAP